jgi:hypothetical protein
MVNSVEEGQWWGADINALVFYAMNVEQVTEKRRIYCVDSRDTEALFSLRADPHGFAACLFNKILGGDTALFPKSLVMVKHVDQSHFVTLILLAGLKKMWVYDGLSISDTARASITEFAVQGFGIQSANVEHRPMVRQTENPAYLCLDYAMCVANGARQCLLPVPVSCFILPFSAWSYMVDW